MLTPFLSRGPLVSLYPAVLLPASPAGAAGISGWLPEPGGARMVAIRVADLRSPVRRPPGGEDRTALTAAGAGPTAIPWNRGHLRIVDSCNSALFLTIERQFTFIDLASAGTRGPAGTGRAAPRAGAGLGLPASPVPGAAGGSALKAGLGVYMCQAA